MSHASRNIPDELQRLKEYHGHLGPFAVVGYVAGRIGLKRLGARKYFGIRATVECEPTPPQSCIVDGVQVAAGCTYGKRNIQLRESSRVAIHFHNTDTSGKCTLRLREELPGEFKRWLQQTDEETAAMKAFEMGPALFLPD